MTLVICGLVCAMIGAAFGFTLAALLTVAQNADRRDDQPE